MIKFLNIFQRTSLPIFITHPRTEENFDKPRIEIYGEAVDRNNLEEERELRGNSFVRGFRGVRVLSLPAVGSRSRETMNVFLSLLSPPSFFFSIFSRAREGERERSERGEIGLKTTTLPAHRTFSCEPRCSQDEPGRARL